MNEHPEQPVTSELIEALRQLSAANQQIAHSLVNLEKLYAEGLRMREEDHRLYAESLRMRDEDQRHATEQRKEWNEYQRQAKEENQERAKMPSIPWAMKLGWGLFWGLLLLLLVLLILILAWHLIGLVCGWPVVG